MTNQERLQQNNTKIESMQQALADIIRSSDIDLTQVTATADTVLRSKKFYNADGELVEGTFQDRFQEYADTMGFQSLFSGYPTETIPYLSKLDTSKATSMEGMFYQCSNLTSLDLSNFDTKNVTSMRNMFYNCPKLTSLDLSSFDTSNVTTMEGMFRYCGVTELNLGNFNTSKVTNMSYMFGNLKKLNPSNYSNILSSLDTSNVTNMGNMFEYSNVVSMDFSNININNVTNMAYMFQHSSLRDLYGLDLKNVKDMYYTFYYAFSIKNIFFKNIKINLQLGSGSSWGYYLTNESLINTAQQLWDNTDNALGGSRKLTLSTTSKNNIANIYVKLVDITDEMRAEDPYIDNKKPCVVCESTDEGAMTLTEYVISKNWAVA